MFGYSGMGIGSGMGMLSMVLFWGIIIALVVILIRRMTVQSYPNKLESPFEIAKRRYAKGELTKDQFDSKTYDLN